MHIRRDGARRSRNRIIALTAEDAERQRRDHTCRTHAGQFRHLLFELLKEKRTAFPRIALGGGVDLHDKKVFRPEAQVD